MLFFNKTIVIFLQLRKVNNKKKIVYEDHDSII